MLEARDKEENWERQVDPRNPQKLNQKQHERNMESKVDVMAL
jgi:hypothetical protein